MIFITKEEAIFLRSCLQQRIMLKMKIRDEEKDIVIKGDLNDVVQDLMARSISLTRRINADKD